jgi:pSer/pThr/pTyr-binding forkhead associated (FHA) protein
MTVLTPRPTAAPATDAPTAVLRPGAVLHRVRSAAAAVWRLTPGRYLAIADGDEVVVTRLGGLTRIGRRPGADVVLDDATVSRRHALVVERDGESIIADDRSRNGLFVNGRRVLPAPLHNGDEIQLGALVMRFLVVRPTPR